jgi:hypothetical protein
VALFAGASAEGSNELPFTAERSGFSFWSVIERSNVTRHAKSAGFCSLPFGVKELGDGFEVVSHVECHSTQQHKRRTFRSRLYECDGISVDEDRGATRLQKLDHFHSDKTIEWSGVSAVFRSGLSMPA